MKVVQVEIYRYSIPLIKPLLVKSTTLTERNGLLLKLTDEQSNISFGEISPLPGFHHESLEQAEQQLLSHRENLKSEYSDYPNKRYRYLPESLQQSKIFSSVQFGIEMAIWNFISTTDQPHHKIKVNGLLTGPPESMIENAKQLLNKGYDVLKLKVGQQDIDGDISFIHQLRKTVGTQFQLRLDANRKWDFDEAVYFARNLSNIQIDYIEEPLINFDRLEEFYRQTQLSFAIDESFPELDELPPSTKALILKPSFIGGIQKTFELINLAQSRSIQPVVTSAFESGLGLRTLAKLAGQIPGDTAMGLDTFRWFKEDLVEPAFNVKNGFVDISPLKNKYEFNHSIIEKIR